MPPSFYMLRIDSLSRITRKVAQHRVKDFAAAQMGTKQRTKFEDTQTSGSLLTPIKSLFTTPGVFLWRTSFY